MGMWDKFRTEDVPEALKGLTPQQIMEKLQAGESATARVTQLEADNAKLNQDLGGIRTDFDVTKQRLADIEAQRTAPPPTPDPKDDDTLNYFLDPKKAVEESTKQMQAQLHAQGALQAQMLFMGQLSQRDRGILTKYQGEFNKILDSYTPDVKVNPMTWQNSFLYLKGLHDSEIRDMERTNSTFFSEGGGNPPPAPVVEEKLTDDELAMCKSMRWDADAYLKTKKGMRIEGNHAFFGPGGR